MSDDDVREADQLDGVPFPESRTGIVGHAEAMATIMAAVETGRVPGGLLLHGPRGVGKATLAFEVARRLFARTGDESPAHIPAQVAAGAYPNLRVLRRTPRDTGKGFYTAIRVEDVRDLIGEARLTRGRAGFRVVIVDSIDDCNASSSNALLKILEEPPPDTLFILISHRPGGLLPTIKSRCRQIALRPLSDDEVRTVLGQTAGADAAVALSGGRPRRAYEALAMGEDRSLLDLRGWLGNPAGGTAAVYLGLAEKLGSDRDSTAFAFARELLTGWIAQEAKAGVAPLNRARLASAQALWDKATALFADAETYNLDARQTLISIMDGIRAHAQSQLQPAQAR